MERIAVLTLSATILLVSYDAYSNSSKTQRGAMIGTAGGALLGAISGSNIGNGQNSKLGAVLGTVVGGVAGAIIGNQMDKQAKKIEEEIPGAEVERVDDDIVATFNKNSGVYFETAEHNINEKSGETLNKLTTVPKGYPETSIVVTGYTDSVGKDEYDISLSKRRTQSVTNYFTSNGLAASRFTAKWFGGQNPVANNDTPEGRAKSHRVNVVIVPSEKIRTGAEKSADQN